MAEPTPITDIRSLAFDDLVGVLRAVAEPTRLRLVTLLAQGELTVTEITQVIGQSQPRVSRHLRLLVDAGVLERSPEGAFVFYGLADGAASTLAAQISTAASPGDTVLASDAAALERVRQTRSAAAAAYLNEHGDELAALRALHAPEAEIEREMLELLVREGPIGRLLDIGTGTGRALGLLAPHSQRSIGLDVDHEMLLLARATLGDAQVASASVRQGDVHRPPFEAASFDVAVMHFVLHLLDDPSGALTDAGRLLRPGGRLLVVDFATHAMTLLKERHGHRRLGIADTDMAAWARDASLAIEDERTLPAPVEGDSGLTVRLWLLRAGMGAVRVAGRAG